MRIYLAAPFFNPAQVAVVERLETIARSFGHGLYSPREDGVLLDVPREDRDRASAKMFLTNCREIRKANLVFAVIDGRDQGVIWEIGFAYGIGTMVVTFSNEGHGVNLMIRYAAAAHVRGLERAPTFFNAPYSVAEFQDFDPAAT